MGIFDAVSAAIYLDHPMSIAEVMEGQGLLTHYTERTAIGASNN
ncbi:MAG: hypothetical protein ACLSA6_09060 [Holdemania massiliensis]